MGKVIHIPRSTSIWLPCNTSRHGSPGQLCPQQWQLCSASRPSPSSPSQSPCSSSSRRPRSSPSSRSPCRPRGVSSVSSDVCWYFDLCRQEADSLIGQFTPWDILSTSPSKFDLLIFVLYFRSLLGLSRTFFASSEIAFFFSP